MSRYITNIWAGTLTPFTITSGTVTTESNTDFTPIVGSSAVKMYSATTYNQGDIHATRTQLGLPTTTGLGYYTRHYIRRIGTARDTENMKTDIVYNSGSQRGFRYTTSKTIQPTVNYGAKTAGVYVIPTTEWTIIEMYTLLNGASSSFIIKISNQAGTLQETLTDTTNNTADYISYINIEDGGWNYVGGDYYNGFCLNTSAGTTDNSWIGAYVPPSNANGNFFKFF